MRRLWAGEIVSSAELAASDLAAAWQECDLEFKGPSLIPVGSAGCRDAIRGPLGELVVRRAEQVTVGAITAVHWRSSKRLSSSRSNQTSDVDVFNVYDPLLDANPAILAGLRAAIPTDAAPAAYAAVGALRLVGASRHRGQRPRRS